MTGTMIDLNNFIDRQFPGIGKGICKALYNFLAWRFQTQDWIFMNYGYADENSNGKLQLAAEDEKNRYFIQMYAQLLSQIEVEDRDILEVGCGRGGGSAWLARSQKIRSMTGIDLSKNAINLCQKLHQHKNLTYVQADAEQLPFPDRSFDIVLNIESCHHYPSMPRFLEEVNRVLRPNRYFWMVDYREIDEIEKLKLDLDNADLSLIQFTDITANVVKALDLTESLKMELIQRHVPYFLLPLLKTFSAVKGTEVYKRFVQGQLIYVEALLKKTET